MDRAPQAAQLTPCRQCGTGFVQKRPWQHFCSKPCRRAWHKLGGVKPDPRVDDLQKEVAELKARVEKLEGFTHSVVVTVDGQPKPLVVSPK